MKNAFLLVAISLGWLFIQAQPQSMQADSWSIKWHKRTLIKTGTENEQVNKKTIKRDELNRNYCLQINYTESDPKKEKEWTRSFLLFDDKDHEILRLDSTRNATITAAELKKAVGDLNIIKVYTIALPKDPALAASVRVRRVHLGTIELK